MTDTSVFEFPSKEELVQHYELMLLVSGNATDEDAAATFVAAKELLTTAGAEITHEDAIGRKPLAYSIDKSRQGSYFVAEFDLITGRLPELNEKMRIRKDVARFMIIKKQKRTPEEIAKDQEWTRKREEYHANKMATVAAGTTRVARTNDVVFEKVETLEAAKEVTDKAAE